MSLTDGDQRSLTITADNIGGIDHSEVSIGPGVTILTGRNATNRTSFLQALMAGMGSTKPSLKGDAEEGEVLVELGDETYRRRLERTSNGVTFQGDAYLEDADLADTFAFLLGDNEARLAVERGEDLHDVIMDPVDTASIEAEIDRLETEKRDLEDELEHLSSLKDDLPGLEAEKRSLEEELEEKRASLEDRRAEVDAQDVDPEEHKEEQAELEELFDELRTKRSDLDSIEFDLETERESLEELESEREDLETELENLDDDIEDPDALQSRIQTLRDRKQNLDSTLNELQRVIGFNEDALEGGGPELGGAVESTDDRDVTDALVSDPDDIVCWTCGSEVTTDRVEETIEELRSIRSDLVTDRDELQEEIETLTDERDQRRERKRSHERKRNRLASLEDDLDRTRERIASLEQDREEMQAAVEQLETDVEEFETTDHDGLLEAHRKVNELEIEIDRLESERESVTDRIEEIEQELGRQDDIQSEREELQEELTDLRTRVDQIEADAVESFNDHMASILGTLEYENIERIWIEQRQEEVREGRRTVSQTVFDLHVVRTTEDGTTYRDEVQHLSESEREVTGLVFALAGFLVHDLAEELPVMLLDSLEAIDTDRIASLIEYFETYVDYLVVVLLPEDASGISDRYDYVREI
ncbi:AAA family ATPase [Salinarchaeum chitinilyticum]